MRQRPRPMLLARGGPLVFPDPRGVDDEGLVAVGGDLSPARLLFAYASGIFPWYDEGLPPLWWSPDPRSVIDPSSLHVSRSLRRKLDRFELSYNRAFERVMRECGQGRDGGTWILPEMVTAYVRLHRGGHAHSVEVWRGEQLVGGLYGVQVGGLFAAESMFHREADASKVALVAAVHTTFGAGTRLFDVQFSTPHLVRMGAYDLPRAGYLDRLAQAIHVDVDLAGAQVRLSG